MASKHGEERLSLTCGRSRGRRGSYQRWVEVLDLIRKCREKLRRQNDHTQKRPVSWASTSNGLWQRLQPRGRMAGGSAQARSSLSSKGWFKSGQAWRPQGSHKSCAARLAVRTLLGCKARLQVSTAVDERFCHHFEEQPALCTIRVREGYTDVSRRGHRRQLQRLGFEASIIPTTRAAAETRGSLEGTPWLASRHTCLRPSPLPE